VSLAELSATDPDDPATYSYGWAVTDEADIPAAYRTEHDTNVYPVILFRNSLVLPGLYSGLKKVCYIGLS
jgi:hypothetical protein